MRITVNPSAEVSQFNPVKNGTYTLRIETVEKKDGPKAPYLVWRLAIITPTDELCGIDGETLKGAPGSIFENTSLAENAQFRLRELVEAAGESWDDFDTEDMLGKEVTATVTYDTEYSKNKVGKFLAE